MERNFATIIISWYKKNKRDLPWRDTKDPYKIWLSEIILQQTRVVQGLPYFEAFLNKYPDVRALANAPEQDVLKLWQGLGYYSRARNLLFTARDIVVNYKGVFPRSYKGLLELKGVGTYTAAAIASFSYNENIATVDGNVYRTLARYYGIKTPINTSSAKKEFNELANEIIDKDNPGLFNQALMEFGALQCVPSSPDCENCPLATSCKALQLQQVTILPIKEKKIKIRKRFFNYLVISNNGKTYMQKREGRGIWQNLYEFPLIETAAEIDYKELIRQDKFLAITKNQDFSLQLLYPNLIHKLSHQHLNIKFWLVEGLFLSDKMLTWEKAISLPSPIVIHNFLEAFIKE